MRKDGSDVSHKDTLGKLPRRRVVMQLIYDAGVSLYRLAIAVSAPFNPKAKLWIGGRKGWQQQFQEKLPAGEKRIWVHCSSMGEFEQAKPLIEVMKVEYPSYKFVVTFFSPSGYEACKNSNLIDYPFYLPHDSGDNAKQFLDIVAPAMAIFIKYEFWYHYLVRLQVLNIPTLLVSGAFREGQPFFKPYGGLFRDMLSCFRWFFLQDEESERMLSTIGITDNVSVSGDTRYDRVSAIAKGISPIAPVENFKGQHKLLIAGSTWPGDEDVLKECLSIFPVGWKLVLVPHEIGSAHISDIQKLFGESAVLYSALTADYSGSDKHVLIVNNMGMLSRMFSYGDVAFIGGGFQKGGIHNILEPAVFGLPVVFGPVYQKFVEAKELVALNYVFPVSDAGECRSILTKLFTDDQHRTAIGNALRHFMETHTGASKAVVGTISNRKWLY